MTRREYSIHSDLATFRIRATLWPSGRRVRKLLPAVKAHEAEARFRSLYHAPGGYTMETTRVASYWREPLE
jgi:hypothetical protein